MSTQQKNLTVQAAKGFEMQISNPNNDNTLRAKPTVSEFLAAFFPNPDEPVHLRAFKAKCAPDTSDNYAKKYETTCKRLPSDSHLKHKLLKDSETRGIYFVVNSGGHTDEEITRYNAFFAENDTLPIAEQHETR